MLDLDNSSEFTLVYFMISVYEVKLHNRAADSADVSASSLPQVWLTPLEIENGKGLVLPTNGPTVPDAHKHTHASKHFPFMGYIYIFPCSPRARYILKHE